MGAYFAALFTAIAYGLGVLVGMSIISYVLVALGGGTSAPVAHDDSHHGHGHSHDAHASSVPVPVAAPTTAPVVAEPAQPPAVEAEEKPAEEKPASSTDA
jgi:hypothetical protein